MKLPRYLKAFIVLGLFLTFVVVQNYVLRPRAPQPGEAPKAEVEAPRSGALPASEPASPVSGMPPAEQPPAPAPGEPASSESDDAGVTALDPSSVDAVAEQGLATLERIRSVPGAAPLVDEIVAFLQTNPYNEFSLDDLGADEEGLVEVNEDTIKRMIRNDDIRAKWQRLMGLVAKYPDVVAQLQGQANVQ